MVVSRKLAKGSFSRNPTNAQSRHPRSILSRLHHIAKLEADVDGPLHRKPEAGELGLDGRSPPTVPH